MFCHHRWQHLCSQTVAFQRPGGLAPDRRTRVLSECTGCGKLRTTFVDGAWVLESPKERSWLPGLEEEEVLHAV